MAYWPDPGKVDRDSKTGRLPGNNSNNALAHADDEKHNIRRKTASNAHHNFYVLSMIQRRLEEQANHLISLTCGLLLSRTSRRGSVHRSGGK